MILEAYRAWLERQRKINKPWFRAYEEAANALVRMIRQGRPPQKRLATAHRFDGSTPKTPEAWARVFAQLAKPATTTQPPRISILTPAWNTRPEWFCAAAVSVLDQTCSDWEWIVVDDGSTDTGYHPYAARLAAVCGEGRFRLAKTGANRGISGATNHALGLARAEIVCLLDHDDLLDAEAIRLCLEHFAEDVDAVYTDSDKVAAQGGKRSEPFHKPAWSPEYFLGVMYVGHLLCVRRDLALRCGGFDPRFDGVQDFEFFLRYTEQCTGRIEHIPEILYHWRRAEGSLASASDAKDRIGPLQQAAVQEHLQRTGRNASAQPGPGPHRVSIVPGPRKTHPLVSIVIPTHDAPDMLVACLDSIRQGSTYPELQIICADHDTTDPDALHKMAEPGIERVVCTGTPNLARTANRAIREAARGEFLVLLSNGVEVLTPNWIEELLHYAEQPDGGAAGALLLYPDDRSVQHAGVALGLHGAADHIMRGFPEDSDGYAGSLCCAREVSAVSGACLMVRRTQFDRIGGMNEHYQAQYQDIDFCLRLRQDLGLRNVFTPRAKLLHHESKVRNSDHNLLDRALFLDAWDEWILNDPYFNPHFSRESAGYRL